MAVVEAFLATWSGGSAYARVESYESGRNDAAGWVDIYWWNGWRDTHPSVSGSWDWSRYGQAPNGSGSVGASTGIVGIASGTSRVYCDANGNYADYGLGEHMDVYYGNGDAVVHVDPGRSPLAPTISSNTSSAVKPTTATLNGAVSSNGHGTSTTITYYYRLGTSGGYTNAGTGSSVNLTGLKPGSLYNWYITAYNNNGDTATGAVQSFTTQAVPAMITVLMGTLA